MMRPGEKKKKHGKKKVQKKGIGLMMKWSGCSQCACLYMRSCRYACVCVCVHIFVRGYFRHQLWAAGGGAGCVETGGEPCHVFMLTNELITQPLIYLNLCHFTGMLQQSNACRLWVISWQLKANYYSSNSSTHQALNHKCCSRSICLLVNLLSENVTMGLKFKSKQADVNILPFISKMIWLLVYLLEHISFFATR